LEFYPLLSKLAKVENTKSVWRKSVIEHKLKV
jgi:hypothetical protein